MKLGYVRGGEAAGRAREARQPFEPLETPLLPLGGRLQVPMRLLLSPTSPTGQCLPLSFPLSSHLSSHLSSRLSSHLSSHLSSPLTSRLPSPLVPGRRARRAACAGAHPPRAARRGLRHVGHAAAAVRPAVLAAAYARRAVARPLPPLLPRRHWPRRRSEPPRGRRGLLVLVRRPARRQCRARRQRHRRQRSELLRRQQRRGRRDAHQRQPAEREQRRAQRRRRRHRRAGRRLRAARVAADAAAAHHGHLRRRHRAVDAHGRRPRRDDPTLLRQQQPLWRRAAASAQGADAAGRQPHPPRRRPRGRLGAAAALALRRRRAQPPLVRLYPALPGGYVPPCRCLYPLPSPAYRYELHAVDDVRIVRGAALDPVAMPVQISSNGQQFSPAACADDANDRVAAGVASASGLATPPPPPGAVLAEPTSCAPRYVYHGAPAMSSVWPALGPTHGGTLLTVRGAQLHGGTSYRCRFDDHVQPVRRLASRPTPLAQ